METPLAIASAADAASLVRDFAACKSRTRPWAFPALLLFIGLVSCYDGYLVVRTGDLILDLEKNPIGVYLIEHNGGDPALFLIAKAAGTLLVVSVLGFLNRYFQRLAVPVTYSLAAFQSGLLCFLEIN